MPVPAVFGLSVLMSFIASIIVAMLFVVPKLRKMQRDDALLALTAPHMFRFIGLTFLVPGVVSSSLPSAFAAPAAYGDLVATILAMIAALALYSRSSFAIAVVWLLNLWGTADLVNAIYQGEIGIDPGMLGAAFYIPTLVVPPLLVTHALMFWLLLRKGKR